MGCAVVFFCAFLKVGSVFSQEQLRAPEIKGQVWINAGCYDRISIKKLRGRVVLVFFYTSLDSNCDAAVLLLNDWYALYKTQGFEIIGVYTPEWGFDGAESEIYEKVESLGMRFPVVVDRDSSVRFAYGLTMWPSFCLIDRGSYIRAQYDAGVVYPEMKKMLTTLLEEGEPQAFLRRNSKL